jgi:hypothetical protein
MTTVITTRPGRPKKIRPKKGDPVLPGMSLRDIAACLPGRWTPKMLAKCIAISEIPKDQFEEAVEQGDWPLKAVDRLLILRRRGTGKAEFYVRRCPHCHKPLRLEDVR